MTLFQEELARAELEVQVCILIMLGLREQAFFMAAEIFNSLELEVERHNNYDFIVMRWFFGDDIDNEKVKYYLKDVVGLASSHLTQMRKGEQKGEQNDSI